MANKTIHTLLAKFFGNNLPKSTQLSFREWFVGGTSQQEKEEAMLDIWEQVPGEANEQTKQELTRLHRRIHTASKPVVKRTLFRQFVRVAAILLLPLLGAAAAYFVMQSEPRMIEPEWTECFVPNGERKQIFLSDGSEVWLNSGSLLLYSARFEGNKRSIYLNGEASFKVAKDPDKPFIVKTGHMEVEALGTLFNVEAYSDSKLTIATLEEGKVRVTTDLAPGKPIILCPNEQIIYNSQSGLVSKEEVDAARVLQWKHGYLTFQGSSFDHIVKTIERRFDVTINYETNKFAGRSFTMKFRPDEGLIQVLDILKEMVNGLHYRVKDNIIYIN
ncbi:FecR family protein [uncultured Parabacteroides sp.]|uniref:FecR family protein n=1 Tax=uncultured Parabacteroides sp. TaxID=512312 RepID=UPI00258DC6A9|nr:FecR family protein [uncultured Parabacteroides sp.]